MLLTRHRIACAVVLILFFSASGTSVWAQAPGPSSAGRAGSLAVQQDPFAEPDTIPRFALGPVVELKFRGGLGELDATTSIGLSNGPTFGARAELRLNRTVTFVVRGSYARTEEKEESAGSAFFAGNMTHIETAGELLLKGRASVPGYFIFGGGVRFVNPDAVVAGDATTARSTKEESTTESLIIAGVGLELGGRRRGVFRIEGRFTFSFPTEQSFETKSVATDFALGLAYLFRF